MNKTKMLGQFALLATGLLLASCATTRHNVLMGDVISFSEEATTSYTSSGKGLTLTQSDPYIIHSDAVNYDKTAVFNLKRQIKTAPSQVNTSITYAQDLGLERIKYIRKHQLKNDKSTRYFTFILTDGLDNTSVDVARNHKRGNYKNLEKYQNANKKKIKRLMGIGKEQNEYKVYPILVIGPDLQEFHHEQMPELSDSQFADLCRSEYMESYRGASRGYDAPEPIVTYSFASALDMIKNQFAQSSFEFYVPKGYKGKQVKMELVDENGVHVTFEGKVTKKMGKYYFTDIVFNDNNKLTSSLVSAKQKKVGLKAINNDDKNAIVAWFRLEDLKVGDKTFKVVRDLTKQSYQTTLKNGKTYYQYNSEYDKSAMPQIDTYFQLIFDTSGSIGENVEDEQKVLFEILDIMTRDLSK